MHSLDEVAALLNIHEKASAHGDAMKTLADAAYKRLTQINSEMSSDALMKLPEEEAIAKPSKESDDAA